MPFFGFLVLLKPFLADFRNFLSRLSDVAVYWAIGARDLSGICFGPPGGGRALFSAQQVSFEELDPSTTLATPGIWNLNLTSSAAPLCSPKPYSRQRLIAAARYHFARCVRAGGGPTDGIRLLNLFIETLAS